METMDLRQRNAGLAAFFFSGVCAISCGVVVSILQEHYGFSYDTTGTLLATMNVGNLIAGFAAGALCGRLGMKLTALIMSIGYFLGYLVMGLSSSVMLFGLSFLMVGLAKGCILNTCTIMVGNNSANRTKGMNIMHSCYACGALTCPFLIALAGKISPMAPMFMLSAMGAVLWLVYALNPIGEKAGAKSRTTDWSFFRQKRFWLLTLLLFCQISAENGVIGWLVTYFKDEGILSGTLATYTVSILWGTTMVVRLLVAFVFPFKNPAKAMIVMGCGCTVFYTALMQAHSQWPAVLLLFCFSASIAGMNPTAVGSAGKMMSVASMGIMLPTSSLGGIVMPWVIGTVAEKAGLHVGMATNIIPCIGMMVFAWLLTRLKPETE